VRTTGVTITVPIYPLAPNGTAATVIPVVADIAVALGDPVLMGDSAGGAIALGAAQLLRDRGIALRTILISPELDLTLSDPMLKKIEPWDPWLAIPGAAVSNELWAGDLPLTDPLVSPMLGSLDGLAPVTLFCGTRDMLHADATAFVARAKRAGVSIDFREARGMIHVYPLLPIPEAEAARTVMRAVLRG
jgi:acetyl esterase/lipase